MFASGSYGCLVREGAKVRKFFVTSTGQESFRNETRPELLEVLRRIDPLRERFVQAEDVSQAFFVDPAVYQACVDRMMQTEGDSPSLKFMENPVPSFVMDPLIATSGAFTRAQQDFLKESMKVLHDNGWVHGDLHFGNIMMSPKDYRLRIVDFGLAESMDVLGTDNFAAKIVQDTTMLNAAIQRSLQPVRKRTRQED